jgi:hypothetical protein
MLKFIVLTMAAAVASAANPCDRECLINIADQYLAAM